MIYCFVKRRWNTILARFEGAHRAHWKASFSIIVCSSKTTWTLVFAIFLHLKCGDFVILVLKSDILLPHDDCMNLPDVTLAAQDLTIQRIASETVLWNIFYVKTFKPGSSSIIGESSSTDLAAETVDMIVLTQGLQRSLLPVQQNVYFHVKLLFSEWFQSHHEDEWFPGSQHT